MYIGILFVETVVLESVFVVLAVVVVVVALV